MEQKTYCPECGHEFKQGESDYNYETGDTVCTCPECGWEGTAPDDEENEEDYDDTPEEAMVIEVRRTDYSIGQVLSNRNCMTVGKLKRMLEDYDEDDPTPIVFSHDNGYIYGPMQESGIEFREF